MEARPLELSELMDRQRWLVNLRWTAAASVAAITAILRWLVGIDLQVLPLFLIAAVIALYNLAFWLYTRAPRADHQQARRAVAVANLQISLDLIALTFVLHFVGGVENPFYLYYIFHVIIASILLSRLATFLQATLAAALFLSLSVLEYFGFVSHVSIPQLGTDDLYDHSPYVVAVLASLITTLYFAAYMATSIVAGLRSREAQIIELKEILEKEERKLGEAYARLQEVERFKSQYLRKVSHELRAPLSSIQSLITVVLEGLTGSIPDKTREILERASIRARELLDLVADLLVLSRSREARVEQVRQSISLEEIASRIIPLFQAQAVDKGIDLTISIQSGLPTIEADPEGIEELLSNLMSNAIKYTLPGGKVWVTTEAKDGSIVLTTSDTGIGIEPEELPHIFEEFHRTNRAKKMAEEGTGLGLAIVKAIVDAHGGTIEINSKVGKGTTFVVTLPIAKEKGSGVNNRESEVKGGGSRVEGRGREFSAPPPSTLRPPP